MYTIHRLVFCCALTLVLCLQAPSLSFAESKLSIGEKATLQAVMQRHIDRQLVAGAYLHLDWTKGTVRRLHPVSAHPMILQMGEFFVLCSDFRDDDGRKVNIDFYIARKGRSHVVFQTEIDNRKPLMKLMNQGKATVAN